MKKDKKAGFLNAIFILLIAILTFSVICPVGISCQTVPQKQDAVPVQPDAAGVYAMSSGRVGSVAALAAGLIGVIFGGMALLRPAGRFAAASGRLGSVVALTAGLIGASIGGLVVLTSAGGIGTGNGMGGAVIAIVLGLFAVAVGGLALSRSRRTG